MSRKIIIHLPDDLDDEGQADFANVVWWVTMVPFNADPVWREARDNDEVGLEIVAPDRDLVHSLMQRQHDEQPYWNGAEWSDD